MNRDKKKTYILSAIICALLVLANFFAVEQSAIMTACLLVPLSVLVFFSIKKRQIPLISKYTVLLIVGVSGLLYIMLYFWLGVRFGMASKGQSMNEKLLFTTVIPIILSIIASEIIRGVLLAQNSKPLSIMAYISCTMADILLVGGFAGVKSFNSFMDLFGLVILSAISRNWLYNYLSKRYGWLPSILLHLMLSLFTVVIPYVPLTPEAIVAFMGLIFPILLNVFINALFERKITSHKKTGKLTYIGSAVVLVLMISTVMLLSCRFTYGALVIGSGSMSGELNAGDAVVYERYEGQVIQAGDVIVFRSGNSRVIHRVQEINVVNGEIRYITKGDANEDPDMGYRVASDILGVVEFKVSYIGYPSIWLRDLF